MNDEEIQELLDREEKLHEYTRDQFISEVKYKLEYWMIFLHRGEIDHLFSDMPYVPRLNDESAKMVAESIRHTMDAGWF